MSIYKHLYTGDHITGDKYKYLSPFEQERHILVAVFNDDGQLIYSNLPSKK